MDCTTTHIIVLIEHLAARESLSPRTVSRIVTGSGDTIDRLAAGHDITTRRAHRVVQNLSDRWPADFAWPADIPRPEPLPAGEEAA